MKEHHRGAHAATDKITYPVVEVRDDQNHGDHEDASGFMISDLSGEDSFDVELIEEHPVSSRSSSPIASESSSSTEGDVTSQANERSWMLERKGINFLNPRTQSANMHVETAQSIKNPDKDSTERECNNNRTKKLANEKSIFKNIIDDFTTKGDQKILRAIGRTAMVNAAVLVTAVTGGAAGAVGYAAGGAITAKRLSDGIVRDDEREVTKSLAVYGCATGASVAGQAAAGAIMIGLAGASLPIAGAVAFGVGCCSGITAGALSEWTVDSVMDRMKRSRRRGGNNIPERCESSPSFCSEGDSPVVTNEMTRSQSCQF